MGCGRLIRLFVGFVRCLEGAIVLLMYVITAVGVMTILAHNAVSVDPVTVLNTAVTANAWKKGCVLLESVLCTCFLGQTFRYMMKCCSGLDPYKKGCIYR